MTKFVCINICIYGTSKFWSSGPESYFHSPSPLYIKISWSFHSRMILENGCLMIAVWLYVDSTALSANCVCTFPIDRAMWPHWHLISMPIRWICIKFQRQRDVMTAKLNLTYFNCTVHLWSLRIFFLYDTNSSFDADILCRTLSSRCKHYHNVDSISILRIFFMTCIYYTKVQSRHTYSISLIRVLLVTLIKEASHLVGVVTVSSIPKSRRWQTFKEKRICDGDFNIIDLHFQVHKIAAIYIRNPWLPSGKWLF